MDWKQVSQDSWCGQRQKSVRILAVYERADSHSGNPFTPYEAVEAFVESHSKHLQLGERLTYVQGAPGCEGLLAVKAWKVASV